MQQEPVGQYLLVGAIVRAEETLVLQPFDGRVIGRVIPWDGLQFFTGHFAKVFFKVLVVQNAHEFIGAVGNLLPDSLEPLAFGQVSATCQHGCPRFEL
jgi:hypothetical protein